jgi:nicotinic acid mononucleotide adenylyltransferase
MGQMKKYSQFLKELPSKTVVFAFGRFNPPTTGHELLVKAVKKLAQQNNASHAIYASKSQDAKKNPLTVDKKVHYLDLMFPGTNFVAANQNERTFIEAAKALNKKYKNIIMVAGSDRISEYQRILNTYNGKEFNFDTVQVISAGERDPDADDASGMSASKMRSVASKGDYSQFKKGLPSTMREIDGRRLMNDVRHGMGLEPIKEQLNLVKDDLREQYFRGEIFNIGDIVECADVSYEIVKRGSNHLLLKEESGKLVSKWIQDVTASTQEINLEDKMIPEELTDKTLKSQDKIKVARIIATMLGIENAESSSNADQLVNNALRKVKSKTFNSDSLRILQQMLNLATEVGIKYDPALKPQKLKEGVKQVSGDDSIPVATDSPVVNTKSTYNLAKDRLRYKDFQRLNSASKGVMEATVDKFKQDGKEAEDDTAATDQHDTDAQAATSVDEPHRTVGHLMTHPYVKDDNLRRRKVKYHLGEEKSIEVTMKSGNKFTAPIKVSSKDWHIVKHPVSGKQYRVDHKGNTLDEEKLEEISAKLAGNYYGASTKKHIDKVGVKANMYDRIEKDMGKQRKAGVDRAMDRVMGARKTNEEIDIDEAVKLGSKVKIHAPGKSYHDQVGHVGEIRNGAYKGAPKTYTVDYGDRNSIQLDKKNVKLHKEEVDLEEGTFAYTMKKAIDAHERGDHKRAKYHLDHAKTARYTLKSTEYGKHRDLLNKYTELSKIHESRNQADKYYDEAEKHKAEASKHNVGTEAHHTHMANHFDAMHRYHSDLGQHGAADKAADKAEAHHEKSLQASGMGSMKEDLDEAVDKDTLRKELNKHTELAIKANRAGDDAAVKQHQVHINKIKERMNKLVRSEQIDMCPTCDDSMGKCSCDSGDVVRDDSKKLGAHNSKGFDAFFEGSDTAVDMSAYEMHNDPDDEISDEELEHMVNSIEDMEDIIDAYDDEELSIIDDETGEEIEDTEEEKSVNENLMLEVLSRIERMKAKIRLKRTQSLRTRKMKIALRTTSGTGKINKRARRLAIKLIKKRLLRGRDASKISVGEKERIERIIQKRKPIIGRLALKLAPRVRSIEKARLSHKKFTKTATPSVGI